MRGRADGDGVEPGAGEIAHRLRSAIGATRVSPPGQNAAISASARASSRAMARAVSDEVTWAISGLKLGRPLASYSRATAAGSAARAARP